MKPFIKSAVASTIATYLLIFIGGLVRVAGAGLGCPDWPKCFGSWIPPVSIDQLPQHIDPVQFNITLAWIEYLNRLAGVFVGLFILVTAVLAVKYCKAYPKLKYTSLGALFLVAFQGWLGGQVVTSELEPVIISVHMVLALVIVSLLIYVAQKAYYVDNPESERGSTYAPNAEKWIFGLWIGTMLQVIMGTQMREGIEKLIEEFPLDTGTEILTKLGSVQNFHTLLAIIMFIGTIHIGAQILKFSDAPSQLVKRSVMGLMSLIAIQIGIGIILTVTGLPAMFQLFHLWVASIYLGLTLIIFNALKEQAGGTHA